MTRPPAALVAALLLAATPAAPLLAQVTTVDEGSFTIFRKGERVGREEFTIRRTPGAEGQPVLVATAVVAYGDRRLAPALRTDSTGTPLAYVLEVRSGAEVQEQLKGTVGRGRFSAVTRTASGESAREYILAEGALILDEEVFHQYHFLARGDGGTLAVLVPRRSRQLALRYETAAGETLTIGGQPIEARHLVLREPGGGRRDVWIDAAGRVLKVELPGTGMLALRDDPPR